MPEQLPQVCQVKLAHVSVRDLVCGSCDSLWNLGFASRPFEYRGKDLERGAEIITSFLSYQSASAVFSIVFLSHLILSFHLAAAVLA